MSKDYSGIAGIAQFVEFVNDEVQWITSAAAEAGQPLEEFIHDTVLKAIGKTPWRFGPYCRDTGRKLWDAETQRN